MIGKIQRVPLREVWSHETHNFTTWLQDNLHVLNDVIDFPLANAEREQSVGNFSVDLVAEDLGGNTVIIENQLEKSDHDHLGKLLTYLVGVEAQVAIWIVAVPRPEHVNVVNWLNESSAASFYLIKVEAICIDDSSPAALLTLIVGPSQEARVVGDTKKELAERHHIRRDFWEELLRRAKEKTTLHANISTTTDNWISAGAGRSGISYNYVILQHGSRVELVIDREDEEENQQIFNTLASSKADIEEIYSDKLGWDSVEGRKVCYIRMINENGGYKDRNEWAKVQDEMIDNMIRLERAFRSHINKI